MESSPLISYPSKNGWLLSEPPPGVLLCWLLLLPSGGLLASSSPRCVSPSSRPPCHLTQPPTAWRPVSPGSSITLCKQVSSVPLPNKTGYVLISDVHATMISFSSWQAELSEGPCVETGQWQRTKSPAPDLKKYATQERCDNRTLVYSKS